MWGVAVDGTRRNGRRYSVVCTALVTARRWRSPLGDRDHTNAIMHALARSTPYPRCRRSRVSFTRFG
jgi:hypothetical protein